MRRSYPVFVLMALALSGAYGQQTGSIVGWGSQVIVEQAALEDLTAIAAGWCHSLSLKSDGSIVAWGNNYSGQCNVPQPNQDFIDIAAAGGNWYRGYSLGLKSDGSIVAWGDNKPGHYDHAASFFKAAANIDPNFEIVRTKSESANTMSYGGEAKERIISVIPIDEGIRFSERDLVNERLDALSRSIRLNFIPGLDNRKPAQEKDIATSLPDPPLPPKRSN